jgi:hypothetical protein
MDPLRAVTADPWACFLLGAATGATLVTVASVLIRFIFSSCDTSYERAPDDDVW